MGDPAHFRVRGGANPHTRTRWGFRKTVNHGLAREQWGLLKNLLTDHGVTVHVVPARESSPGLVFPANAGFLADLHEPWPREKKTFYLSQMLPSRRAEQALYGEFLKALGFRVEAFPRRFEGEADFFPAGDVFLFTSGVLENQRFVPRRGWPPYRRVYGFRSDPAALADLKSLCHREILALTLVRETHYHGDTCLCAFGPRREFLLAYLPALAEESQNRLAARFGKNLVPLSREDGELFSANSFQIDSLRPLLVMPHTVTERLRDQIRERGVDVEATDVSEFMTKGGGSVKCLIGDLGPGG